MAVDANMVAATQTAADAAQSAADTVAETAQEAHIEAAIDAAEEREEQAAELSEELAAAAMRTEIVRQVETYHREMATWRESLETQVQAQAAALATMTTQLADLTLRLTTQPEAPAIAVVSSTPPTLENPEGATAVTVVPADAPGPTAVESAVPAAAPKRRVRLI